MGPECLHHANFQNEWGWGGHTHNTDFNTLQNNPLTFIASRFIIALCDIAAGNLVASHLPIMHYNHRKCGANEPNEKSLISKPNGSFVSQVSIIKDSRGSAFSQNDRKKPRCWHSHIPTLNRRSAILICSGHICILESAWTVTSNSGIPCTLPISTTRIFFFFSVQFIPILWKTWIFCAPSESHKMLANTEYGSWGEGRIFQFIHLIICYLKSLHVQKEPFLNCSWLHTESICHTYMYICTSCEFDQNQKISEPFICFSNVVRCIWNDIQVLERAEL